MIVDLCGLIRTLVAFVFSLSGFSLVKATRRANVFCRRARDFFTHKLESFLVLCDLDFGFNMALLLQLLLLREAFSVIKLVPLALAILAGECSTLRGSHIASIVTLAYLRSVLRALN